MHLVGFTIEIYYDARSYRRQKKNSGFSQTQQYILFIFILMTCFGQMTSIKPSLQNLESGARSANSTLHYCASYVLDNHGIGVFQWKRTTVVWGIDIMAPKKVSKLAKQRIRIRCKLTLRRLMSYIYGAPILDISRSHTTTQHSR